MKRRDLLEGMSVLAAGSLVMKNASLSSKSSLPMEQETGKVLHSVCKWCYRGIPLEEFTDRCKDMGIHSIELLNMNEWDTVLSRGLTCAVANGSELGIIRGFNDVANHKKLLEDLEKIIPAAADKGIPNVICFSGNRNGKSDVEGMENCATGLAPVVKLAERHGINIIMELLNSKVDHKDYQCDHTEWGVQLVEKVGSPRFKLLYDIYHMQIMEGDVIRTLTDNKDYIGHYHTGGVPGRNEINESQELFYPAIVRAIQETGFDGFIGQEFIPTRKDVYESLREGINICTT